MCLELYLWHCVWPINGSRCYRLNWTKQLISNWYWLTKWQLRVVHLETAVHRYRWAQKPMGQVPSPHEHIKKTRTMKQYSVFKQNARQILSLGQRDGRTWRLICKVRQVRHRRTNGRTNTTRCSDFCWESKTQFTEAKNWIMISRTEAIGKARVQKCKFSAI